jgi:hypothetical protein
MRLRHLTAIGAWALVACGDSPRAGSDTGAPAAEPAPDTAAETSSPASGGPGSTAIEIAAVVGGRRLEARGLGECKHAAEAAIYDRPASLWTAQYDGGSGVVGHLNLAFWREAAGTEAVNLALGSGEQVYRIATVQGGEQHGKGRATLEGGAGAGTLVVSGTAEDGTALEVRVRCERFTPLVAEGG